MFKPKIFVQVCAVLLVYSCHAEVNTVKTDPVLIDTNDYQRAEQFLSSNLDGLVLNESVTQHWIGDGNTFWYKRNKGSANITEYVLVDAANGDTKPAFDHQELAKAVTAAVDSDSTAIDATNLPLNVISISGEQGLLTALMGTQLVSCNLGAMQCNVNPFPTPSTGHLPSPNGKHVAFRSDDNLFLREIATGEETQLTTDGAPYYSYAKRPDRALVTLLFERLGIAMPLFGATWSPDGRFLVAPRVDERSLGDMPFVEWVPGNGSARPVQHNLRVSLVGDEGELSFEYFIFDAVSGEKTAITLPGDKLGEGIFTSYQVIGWSESRASFFLLTGPMDGKRITLFEVNAKTGAARQVVEESGEPRVQSHTSLFMLPNIRLIKDGSEVIWYSERSGSGQLYRYDVETGAELNAVTSGPGMIFDIINVNDEMGQVYFTAGGRETGMDPYYRQLYRVGYDGEGLLRLTDADADHEIDGRPIASLDGLSGQPPKPSPLSPNGKYLVITHSRVDLPPVTELRDANNGQLIKTLESADAGALFATGWQVPKRFSVKAADGVTDIYGVIYEPHELNAIASHPVIDAVYGGPQLPVAPRTFHDAYAGFPGSRSSLAALGFAVVTIDGRGTAYRDRAFWEDGYLTFVDVGIDDHIAAIRALKASYPYLDIDRGVGIYGHSWGGTFSGRAILRNPDFYTVAVSSAAIHDYMTTPRGHEFYTGHAIFADGSNKRSQPDEKAVNYEPLDSTLLAENLTGKLMMVFSDLDENVPAASTYQMAAALTRANKRFDLVYIPGETHAFSRTSSYFKRIRWDYFVEHLMNTEPPDNYKIGH